MSLLLKASDFHLSGCNIALKFFDLVIKDELELLQLLSLLFQLIDFLLSISNQLILGRNLSCLITDLLL